MTIRDIAKLANVSKSTVSRIINNDSKVSEKTRAHVMSIIEKYNFTPNNNAANLSRNDTRTIALIVPDIINPFFSKIINDMTAFAKKDGYKIIICNSLEDYDLEKSIVNGVYADRVTAIMLIPTIKTCTEIEEKYLERLITISKKLPLVLIDREVNDKLKGVYVNNEKLAYMAAKILSKNKGKFGIITGPKNETNSIKRLKGFKKFMDENNIDFKIYEGDYTLKSGHESIDFVIDNDLDNIFVCNNEMVLGLYKEIKQKDLKDRFTIMSFEEIENMEYFSQVVKLESFKIPYDKISKKAYDMAINTEKYKESVYIGIGAPLVSYVRAR